MIGTWGMLRAGRLLLAGQSEAAARRGRRAGWLAAAGCAALAVPLLACGLPGIVASAAALGAGAAALLGGLSGKPVPAAWFAAALLAASLVASLLRLV